MFIGLFSTTLFAANFSISPMSAVISAQDQYGQISITNNADQTILFQTKIVAFNPITKQEQPTQDLMLTPPIINIAPGQTQVFRVADMIAPSLTQEKYYHVYFSQVANSTPNANKNNNGASLNFVFNIAIPIYVLPANLQTNLYWSAHLLNAKKIQLTVVNHGNSHIQFYSAGIMNNVTNEALASVEFPKLLYPGQSETVVVDLKFPLTAGDKSLSLNYQSDLSQQTATAVVPLT